MTRDRPTSFRVRLPTNATGPLGLTTLRLTPGHRPGHGTFILLPNARTLRIALAFADKASGVHIRPNGIPRPTEEQVVEQGLVVGDLELLQRAS